MSGTALTCKCGQGEGSVHQATASDGRSVPLASGPTFALNLQLLMAIRQLRLVRQPTVITEQGPRAAQLRMENLGVEGHERLAILPTPLLRSTALLSAGSVLG